MTTQKIETGLIADSAVTTAKLADNSVTAAKIAAGSLDDQVKGISSSADAVAITIDSSENVGIGTTSPSAPLHVAGNIQTDNNYRAYDSVSGSYRNLLGYDSGNVKIQTGTGSSAYGVSIFTAGTERFHVNGSGNIGIGTTSPSSELHMHVTGASNGAQILFDSDYGTGYVGQENNGSNNLIIGSSSAGITFYAANAQKMIIDSSGNLIMTAGGTIRAGGVNDLILDAGESGTPDIFLQSGGATKVKIEGSNGNVGIGTTSPSQKLEVTGKIKVSDDIILAQTNGRLDYDNGVSSGALRFFSTSGNAETMRITSAGNVGIGTTSPTDKLHVVGTSFLNGNTYVGSGGAGNIYLSAGTGIYMDGGTGSANHLDDYEEGTWTPADDNGNNYSSGAQATYTKIGRLVYFNFDIESTGSTSGYKISGLPFTSSSSSVSNNWSVYGGYSTSNADLWGHINASSTRINMYVASATHTLAGRWIGAGWYYTG